MTNLPVVVAIPARNEADRIGACLAALAQQTLARSRIAAVVIYANNCTDSTAAIARNTCLPFALEVVEATLPPNYSHVGYARRGASNAAIACLKRRGHIDGIIANTDADSEVDTGWLAALLAAFGSEVDAVCGEIEIEEPLTSGLMAARAAEAAYADAVARVTALLDPLPHDPWPNHIWSWGANFSVRARVLLSIGGSPLVNLAEDRALHATLLARDFRIRHSRAVRVRTSARVDGRAPGGFADLLAGYAADPAALADFALEPAAVTWQRAQARGKARRQWCDRPGFGAFWAACEAKMPGLARQRVAVDALPSETRQLVARIRAAADRSDTRARATAFAPVLREAARQ
jgi:cellulose synthase/poly-beta-1,6-N-acetylglucosamine synthase-like glycosyltransferase